MAEKDGKDEPAMDLQTLRKMLVRSRREKMSVALAQGDAKSGGPGLVLMNKVMPPRQVLKMLRQQFPTARTPCFGTASVDVDVDPRLVTFTMNRRVPGLDKRLRKSLKGTGFNKVVIQVGEG